jgi:hypothetical protein
MVATSTCYRHVRAQIEDGDLLLFRRPGSLIALATDGCYSHSAMAVWRTRSAAGGAGGVLLCGESREGYGARLVTLSSQVEANPSVIDVYRPDCPLRLRQAAADLMVRQAGHQYSYRGVVQYALLRMGLVNLCLRLARKVQDPQSQPEPGWNDAKFCSEQTTWCYRQAVVATVGDAFLHRLPQRPSQFVTPNDQASCGAFRLVFQGLVL